MSTAQYVTFSGIEGECREDVHKNWMQVEHIQFGVRQSVAYKPGQGGQHYAGEADFQPITVRMNLDKAYPKLAESCWLGKHHDTAEIHFTRAGGDKHKFLTYKFKNVAISSVALVGDARGDDVAPTVEFTFVYEQVQNEYSPTDLTGGGIVGSVVTGFNVATRKSV